MSQKMTAIVSGIAIGITFVFVLPALKRTGLGSIWIILICGVLGGAFSLLLTAINAAISNRGKG